MKPNFLKSIGAVLATVLVQSCFLDENTGTEVPNELTGRILHADGEAAVGAQIRLIPVGFAPSDSGNEPVAILRGQTDGQGRYAIKAGGPGTYNLLFEKDGEFGMLDSVGVVGGSQSLPDGTMGDPASVKGTIRLQPTDDPRIATIQLLGTQNFVNVKADGAFEFHSLAAGNYRLRLSTTNPAYTPYFMTFSVNAGETLTLKDTLEPFFSGVPVVEGLRAVYDTGHGVAHLTWKPIQYSRFQSYQVYRTRPGVFPTPIHLITQVGIQDTNFSDTMWTESQILLDSQSGEVPGNGGVWEYRVLATGRSGEKSLFYESVSVEWVSPWIVRPRIQLQGAALDGAYHASVGDTIEMVVEVRHGTGTAKSVQWLDARDSVIHAHKLPDSGGMVKIRHTVGSREGLETIKLRVEDGLGHSFLQTVVMKVTNQKPVADAGKDVSLHPQDSVRLSGKVLDDGRIVRMQWRIGGEEFKDAPEGEVVVAGPEIGGAPLWCVFRAVDEDSNSHVDSLMIRQGPTFKDHHPFLLSRQVGNRVVFADSSGTLFSSEDGLHWLKSNQSLPGSILSVVSSDSVVYGYTEGGHVLMTRDGLRWQELEANWSGFWSPVFPVGGPLLARFKDGVYDVSNPVHPKPLQVQGCDSKHEMGFWGDTLICQDGNDLFVSRDGKSAVHMAIPNEGAFRQLVGVGDCLFAEYTGEDAAGNTVIVTVMSRDYLHWEPLRLQESVFSMAGAHNSIQFADGKYFSLAWGELRISENGKDWRVVDLASTDWDRSLAVKPGLYVVIAGGKVHLSTDAIKWTQRP